MANVKVIADKQTDGRTDRQTNRRAKNFIHPPNLSMRGGHNKQYENCSRSFYRLEMSFELHSAH